MDYAAYRARGLQIGSGSIESACKQLVTSRLKGAGMIWDDAGAEAVATVRAYLKSERWTAAMARRPHRQRSYRRTPAHPPAAWAAPVPTALPPPEPAPEPARSSHSAPEPPRALPAALREQIQAEVAQERANHPWRQPWSIRQQRRVAAARAP